jgi:Domain of unknown function (DUF1841)
MSSPARGSDDLDRQRFIAGAEVLAALDLSVEDLADPDVREAVIRREHPEFEHAFKEGLEEVDLGDGPINPRLHLTMHQVVAQQLWDDTPPEVWQTVTRLLDQGYDRHEILHMLMRTTANQVWAALHDDRPYDRDRHVAELRALPDSWEHERSALTVERRHDDARKEARRRARAARRRNRRPK